MRCDCALLLVGDFVAQIHRERLFGGDGFAAFEGVGGEAGDGGGVGEGFGVDAGGGGAEALDEGIAVGLPATAGGVPVGGVIK